MIVNRSVPSNSVLPHICYTDIVQAIAWLTTTFGFSEHYRYGDPISGAQVHLGYRTQSLTIFVESVDSHFARAKSAGARILEDPHETIYGERQYAVEDIDGHPWLFSQHARDVSPEEWGATVAR
jgi:uncharacterized glyoxalase superfamily protein PhnB